jgi:outer membrane protein assembly factor BamB
MHRWTAVGIALTIAIGMGGCQPSGPSPVETGSGDAADSLRDGPPASWSLEVSTGEHHVVAAGDVVVVTDHNAILGLDLSSGSQQWRREVDGPYSIQIAEDDLVVQETEKGGIEVFDPATGDTRWQVSRRKLGEDVAVYREAIYSSICRTAPGEPTCSITARGIRDGHTLWTTPSAPENHATSINRYRIGTPEPYAPTSGSHLVAWINGEERPYAALDSTTGTMLPGQAAAGGWYTFAIGNLLVTTNHDPPEGDANCTVRMVAVDARDGDERWSGTVFSGRREDNACEGFLGPYEEYEVIGARPRIAAVTAAGTPQVVDLRTGQAEWEASTPGVPIDGDERTLLVRDYADAGELAVLDFTTGEQRWSAPDPGLSGQSASWDSAVTDGLVAVNGASGDRPFVLVYDADTGQQLGQFPSWLAGAGDDWVAVTHGGADFDTLELEFIRLSP